MCKFIAQNCKYAVWFQASTTKQMRTVLFWVITHRVVVLSYWCFGTTYWSHFQDSRIHTGFLLDSWILKMGPIVCPETSVGNYHYSLRNKPEECSFSSVNMLITTTTIIPIILITFLCSVFALHAETVLLDTHLLYIWFAGALIYVGNKLLLLIRFYISSCSFVDCSLY